MSADASSDLNLTFSVFGNNAQETGQPPSVWRYYLLSQRPENSDSAFMWSSFISANNNELLANLGNFVNRVSLSLTPCGSADVKAIKFANAKYNSIVPGPENFEGGSSKSLHSSSSAESKVDSDFVDDVNARLAEYKKNMDETKLRSGLAMAMQISSRGNQYLQEAGLDNSLLANRPERCGQVILNAINLIYLLSVVIHPFMPSTTTAILSQLNAPARSLPAEFGIDILPGHTLGKADHLFKKIDNVDGAQEKQWQKQFGGDSVVAEKVTPAGPGGHPEGGKVPHAKDLPSADKKAEHAARQAQAAKDKKAAAAAAAKKKTPEEIDLEEKIQAQGKLVAQLRKGTAEGDVEEALGLAKQYKTELAELKAKMKAASIQ